MRTHSLQIVLVIVSAWSTLAPESVCPQRLLAADESPKQLVILDTDLGTYVDDAYALSLLIASERFELLGVTTCTSQAEDRAWIACRFLTSIGMKDVPVAFGRGEQPKSRIKAMQYRQHPAVVWGRTSKPVKESAVELMARLIKANPEKVTILAIGPLTNVGKLLETHPDLKDSIQRIVLMGGKLEATTEAEWNISRDINAAQVVFASGVPLLVTPWESTSSLEVKRKWHDSLFAAHTLLTFELQSLHELTVGPAPQVVLFDPAAVALAYDNSAFTTKAMRLIVDDEGQTVPAKGPPNATVAVAVDKEKCLTQIHQTIHGFGQAVLPKPPANTVKPVPTDWLPPLVHTFEDYDTDIESRWWLCGQAPPLDPLRQAFPANLPGDSHRVCQAVLTQDFDGKMGDLKSRYRAVVFNPVPGPPMGERPRLRFRYRLSGTDTLRVQIFSLSNGYHRYLSLKNLPQDKWAVATVDMTLARRPDGSGGPLSADERIDDIQFYIDPRGQLFIDEMVLYDAPADDPKDGDAKEAEPFPRRILFTGWFDTGKQGREWPGKFDIVEHEKPRSWDYARSVPDEATGRHHLRIDLRGPRRLAEVVRLRFRYRLIGAESFDIALVNSVLDRPELAVVKSTDLPADEWHWHQVEFRLPEEASTADAIQFRLPKRGQLHVDDLLLYVPG